MNVTELFNSMNSVYKLNLSVYVHQCQKAISVKENIYTRTYTLSLKVTEGQHKQSGINGTISPSLIYYNSTIR